MTKKRTSLRDTVFQGVVKPYGKKGSSQSEPEDTLHIPIVEIVVDPNQPRRFIPSNLIDPFLLGELSQEEVMEQWMVTAGNRRIDSLRNLANTIEEHGLLQPVLVREVSLPNRPNAKMIVLGERRFWAHVLLAVEGRKVNTADGLKPATHIQARLAPNNLNLRAAQLIENLEREDINALEKAMGMWALRYEMSGFAMPLDVRGLGRKVNGSSLVNWKDVSKVLGISDRYRIFATSVLNLPAEAQRIIELHDLNEWQLRPVTQKLKGHSELQLKAIKQIATWIQDEELEPSKQVINRLVAQLLRSVEQSQLDTKRDEEGASVTFQTQKFVKGVKRVLKQLETIKDDNMLSTMINEDELEELAQLHARLSNILKQ